MATSGSSTRVPVTFRLSGPVEDPLCDATPPRLRRMTLDVIGASSTSDLVSLSELSCNAV